MKNTVNMNVEEFDFGFAHGSITYNNGLYTARFNGGAVGERFYNIDGTRGELFKFILAEVQIRKTSYLESIAGLDKLAKTLGDDVFNMAKFKK